MSKYACDGERMTKKRSIAYAVKLLRENGPQSTRQMYEEIIQRYPKTHVTMHQLSNLLRFSAEIEIEWRHSDPGHPAGSLRGRVGTIWKMRKK